MKLFSKYSFLILLLGLFAFTIQEESFNKCLLTFDKFKGLTLSSLDKLPDTAPKFRNLETKSGKASVSRIGGYRVLYNNKYDVPFVNMKVEFCSKDQYAQDTTTLINSLDYLLSVSKFMDSEKLHEFDVNGFKIYGYNRNTIEQGSNLGTYVMFPDDNVTVHFYFNNLKPKYRHFNDIETFYNMRDKFFDKYTKYISNCRN
jgi:hypothetical protein